MSTHPTTMRSLALPAYTTPPFYNLLTLPLPSLTRPTDVLIRVVAAGLNPGDMHVAAGAFKFAAKRAPPYKLGADFSGIVAAVGTDVETLKVGDEVWGCLPFEDSGSMSEYVVTLEVFVGLKPAKLGFVEAASLPMVVMTAMKCLDAVEGGVQGKRVLVIGGLGGVGSVACQLAKNVYGAKQVITTVSTRKVGDVHRLLGEGVVDQIIDYQTTFPLSALPPNSIDIIIDSANAALAYLPLMTKAGTIVSFSGIPSGTNLKEFLPQSNTALVWALDTVVKVQRWRVGRYGVKYVSILNKAEPGEMERVRMWVEEGKLRSVVGKTVRLGDIEELRRVCGEVAKGRGGVGKVVVEVGDGSGVEELGTDVDGDIKSGH